MVLIERDRVGHKQPAACEQDLGTGARLAKAAPQYELSGRKFANRTGRGKFDLPIGRRLKLRRERRPVDRQRERLGAARRGNQYAD